MFFSKKVNAAELMELRSVFKVIRQEEFKMIKVAAHKDMVKKGESWVEQQQGIVDVLRLAQRELIQFLAKKYGYPEGMHVTINLSNGTISADKKSKK